MGGNPDFVVLKAGAFDRHDGMKIELKLWAGSRPPWAQIDVALPTHKKNYSPVARRGGGTP